MNSSDLFEAKKNLQTLYVSRKLTNAEDLVAWAHEQGFDKCLDPKEMHVTIAYSKEKIDVSEMTDSFDTVQVSEKKGKKGGKREMKLFGEKKDCVVLVFECPDLHHRWEEFIDEFGASWDHDGYHPHVTISYNGLPEGMKLEDIEPYKGRLEFGPEIHKEVNPKWKSKAKEKKTKPKLDEAKTGTETEAKARKFAADVARFGRSLGVKVEWKYPFAYAEGEIELTGLNAKETGTGAGTKLMTYMGELADEANINVYVQPGNWCNRDFYARFGFQKTNKGSGGCLVRYPTMDPDDQAEFDAIRANANLREDDDAYAREQAGQKEWLAKQREKAASSKPSMPRASEGTASGKTPPGKLPATPENLERAKEFVLKKWRERAAERGLPEPEDLSSSCKFSSLFAQAIFGGQIQGHHEHQYLVLNGEIIDLNKDAADVKAMDDPHTHDESWFGNEDHLDSMESCKPRVRDWVREFTASLNESFTLDSLDDAGVDRLVATFRNSYEAQTGSSWAEDKLLSRASNWTFYGDENGYLAVRRQASGMKKMVAVAGDPKSVLKGMAELQAEGGPIWGAVSGELANVAKKRGMIVPHLIPGGAMLIKTLAKAIPASVFGGVEPKVADNGGIVLDYEDTGSTTKYFVGNKEYFQSAMKLPMVASKISSIPGLKQVLGVMGLNEDIDTGSVLYHGTSVGQFEKMRQAGYVAHNLYLGEDVENICEHYAMMAAAKDGTEPLIMEFDVSKLTGDLRDDIHAGEEDAEAGQFIYDGPFRQAMIRVYTWDEYGEELNLNLNEGVSTNWPTLQFESLYHIGTMNAADKRRGSYEGAGLSVSRHPDSWGRMAKIGGDVWKLTKDGNRFLNFHRLNTDQKNVILSWGVQHRFITHGDQWIVKYWNADLEEENFIECDSAEEAKGEVEHLTEFDDEANPEITHKPSVPKATDKLLVLTNHGAGSAFELLVPVYVEAMLPFDGVWWSDDYDPDRLSAPRGVITRKKVSEWTAERDPNAEDADDGDFD